MAGGGGNASTAAEVLITTTLAASDSVRKGRAASTPLTVPIMSMAKCSFQSEPPPPAEALLT